MQRRPRYKTPDLEKLAKKYTPGEDYTKKLTERLIPQYEYWYIFGYTDMGKPVFLGPEPTEADANRKADEAGLNDVQIKSYRTRNLATASRAMKAELISEMNADAALARMKHKLPEVKR